MAITLDFQSIRNSFLNELPPEHLEALSACARLVHFRPGDLLFERGKPANRFFVTKSGKVNIELYTPERGPQVIQTLNSGQLLGTSWLIEPYRWRTDARASTDVEAIEFDANAVMQRCAADPALGYELLRRCLISVSQRLDAAQEKILSLYSNPA